MPPAPHPTIPTGTHATPHVTTIYYHADCLDGFGAAYAAWRSFGDAARYRPMHHGDAWQTEDVAGRDVFVLDFSFPEDRLTEIARLARSVCQLDHHASAREPWQERLTTDPAAGLEVFEDAALGLTVAFDLTRSGARLAWDLFHPGQALPLAIAHIEDQDMWRFAIPGTRAFCRALRLRPFAFDAWDDIVRGADHRDRERYRSLRAEGEAIERFFAVEVERLAASALIMPVSLAADSGATPVRGSAINCSALFASDLGSRLAERSGTFGLG